MKKSLFILIAMILGIMGVKADLTADWKLHMPYDSWPVQLIETPDRVYILNRTFEYATNLPERSIPSHSLFYYDKKGDEIISVNDRNNSNGNTVSCIAYNPTEKYLLVVYTDCNIDFIYDDGRVFNLQALKITSIPGKKEVNSITMDIPNHTAYLGTSFGYISLNDIKHEVTESRNYGVNIQSIGRVGENIVLCMDDELYFAPTSSQRFGIEDYEKLDGAFPATRIAPLGTSNNFVGFTTGPPGGDIVLYSFVPEDNNFETEVLTMDPNIICYQNTPSGYTLCGNVVVHELTSQGNLSTISGRKETDYRIPATSYNRAELWVLYDREGIVSYKINQDKTLTLSRNKMRPNAPATYITSSFAYHPTYGLLCGSNGYDLAYSDFSQQTPSNISAIKNGLWKEYGFPYSGNSSLIEPNNYGGLSVDPSDQNYVYRSSTLGGLMKVNLSDPSDILILANPSNRNANKPEFIKVAEDPAAWNILCRFTPPVFTSEGTMWTLYNNPDEHRGEIWYWPAADRKATTSSQSYRPMKKIKVPEFTSSNSDVMIALNKTKNIIAIGGSAEEGTILLYDHGGTPETTADDRYVFMNKFFDQDGGSVKFLAINNLFEDPTSGMIWILSQRGLFTVDPVTAFQDPTRVNRIKVARNDGTNLADYLLNEINVNHVSVDGEGRKWFSTSNGLVCTSDDGRTILGEFTTDNSYLPSNNVYASCYNPENNSLMVATEGGLIEMFPSGSGASTSNEDSGIRAYPNPVEPDYYGWVRIDNVPDGSLVKITDAGGGIVKELGPAQSGSVEWDVSGLKGTRVATGVYYIMVSPGSGGEGKTQISKILVLN